MVVRQVDDGKRRWPRTPPRREPLIGRSRCAHKGGQRAALNHLVVAICTRRIALQAASLVYSPRAVVLPIPEAIGASGPTDLALLPIGAAERRAIMASQHLDSAEALGVMQASRAVAMLPIHWGTFRLSGEGMMEPASTIENLAKGRSLWDRVRRVSPGGAVALS